MNERQKIRIRNTREKTDLHQWQAVCPSCGPLGASFTWGVSMARAARHLGEWHGVRI